MTQERGETASVLIVKKKQTIARGNSCSMAENSGSNPFVGTNRIRFYGYNLSLYLGTPFEKLCCNVNVISFACVNIEKKVAICENYCIFLAATFIKERFYVSVHG